MMLKQRATRSAVTRSVRACATPLVTQRASFPSDPTFQFAPVINGCWQLAGGHGREVFENIEDKLAAHADAGFTTFDTADIYGPSEQILGQFQARRAAAGGAPVQVFTKYVPNIFQQRQTPAVVEANMQRAMKNLQVPVLDCVQLHWWDYSLPGMTDTALALADLQARGLIRHVATTNMDTEALSKIVDAGVKVAANQVQFSLLDRRPLNGMLQYCVPRGIKLFTYGSVGGGLLSDRYYEEPKPNFLGQVKYTHFDLNTSSLKMYWNIVKQAGGQEVWRELLAAVKLVADKHDVSFAAVALRWVMQQGDGHTVHPIVGLRGTSHLQDNASVLSFSLDEQDMATLQAVLDKCRGPAGDVYSFERGA